MKHKIFKKAVIVLIALTAFTSCQDLLDTPDIRVNPNAPADAPIDVLLSGTLVGLATVHEDTDTRLSYMWAGQLAGLSRQHAGFGIYNVAASTFDNSWAILYSACANARLIQEKAAPLNNRVALGIGQVIEALLIAKLTVLYGDVPYSQAFKSVEFPKPVFDKQADVYTALIALLNDAYANLSSGVGAVDGSKEFIYGGASASWAKAAKTLQARLYLHLGDNANAITAAGLGIATTGGDALIPHGTAQTIDNNLNFDFFENSRPGDTGFDAPAFLPGFMQTRLDGVAQVAGEAKRNSATDETALYNHFFQIGVYSAGALDPNTIDGMFTGDAPHPLITFYENQLILAEANARLNNTAAAVAALNSVRQALATGYINGKTIDAGYQALGMQYDDYVTTDFTPGGLANPVSTGRDQQSGLLYEIISQKYIVSLAQYNVFTDVRRLAKATPVVQLPIPATTTSGKGIPARFIYPQNEINTNGKNVPSPLPDQYVKLPIFQ